MKIHLTFFTAFSPLCILCLAEKAVPSTRELHNKYRHFHINVKQCITLTLLGEGCFEP